jgi:PiT family inorganic phosphate transporter
MVANGSKLQRTTVRNILIAWGLTLPATITLSAVLFLLLRLALV